MGWASGSYLAQDLWDEIREAIPEKKRKPIARKILSMFMNQDADDWDNKHNLFRDAGYFFKMDEETYEGWFEDNKGRKVSPYDLV
jgi:hypothetical protein